MKIGDRELDILREIVNIGAGNASNSLSSLIGNKVLIEVPQIVRLSVKGVEKNFLQEPLIIVHTSFTENFDSDVFFLISPRDGAKLASALTCREFTERELIESLEDEDSILISSLLETVNIISGSFANAISQLLGGIPVNMNVPSIAFDMISSVVDFSIAHACSNSDYVFLFKTKITSEDKVSNIDLIIIPQKDSIAHLIGRVNGFEN